MDRAQPRRHQAREGDQTSLQQWLVAHCPALHRQITQESPASLPTAVTADDLLQETLFLAVRDFADCRAPTLESFTLWLRAIAENRVRDAAKAAGRRERSPLPAAPTSHAGGAGQSSIVDLVQLVADPGETPSQESAAAEAVHAVQVGVAGLPNDHGAAFALGFETGMRATKISERTD